jgi:hypothetical protein
MHPVNNRSASGVVRATFEDRWDTGLDTEAAVGLDQVLLDAEFNVRVGDRRCR